MPVRPTAVRPGVVCRLFLGAATAVLILFGSSLTSVAQTLDQAVASMLTADCLALRDGDLDPEFGADLDAICNMSFGSAKGSSNSGGAGASSQSLSASVENRRRERLEEDDDESGSDAGANRTRRFGFYVNGSDEVLDRDRTTFADGYDSDVLGLTVGGDYRLTDQLIAGVALAASNHDGDFNAGGGFETDAFEATLYASFLPVAYSHWRPW